MKKQTRNTEVQINEEEIGKRPEKKNQNNDSKDDQNLKTEWRKCKIQLTKA